MSIQDKIAEIAENHRPYGMDCKCGEPINSDAWWARHLADELQKALGFQQEQGVRIPDGYPATSTNFPWRGSQPVNRYVSNWQDA